MCGSPGYAAPEVFKRVGHNKPADIWSVGIITYTILCGFHPFHYAEGFSDLLEAVCKAAFKFDSPYWDDISDDAKRFISVLLQLDPAKRPTAKQAMLQPWILSYIPEARAFAKTLLLKDTIMKNPESAIDIVSKESVPGSRNTTPHTVAADDPSLCLTPSQEQILYRTSHEFQEASDKLVDLSSKWEQNEDGPKMDLTKARRALRRVLTATSLITKLKRASMETLKGKTRPEIEGPSRRTSDEVYADI
jgi:serine/threonine protein kinase